MNQSVLNCFVTTAFAAFCNCVTAAPLYQNGTSPVASSDMTFGTHLISGPHTSVAGVGGGGLSAAGTALDGVRTYIYDQGAQADLTDGIAKRGDVDCASSIWDMGAMYNR